MRRSQLRRPLSGSLRKYGPLDDDDASLDPSRSSIGYTDADGDGYGDPALSSLSCLAGAGAVGNDGDCDDTRADVSPAAAELRGCSGAYDEGHASSEAGAHTGTSILFAATSTLDQGPSAESFGICDVYLWISLGAMARAR